MLLILVHLGITLSKCLILHISGIHCLLPTASAILLHRHAWIAATHCVGMHHWHLAIGHREGARCSHHPTAIHLRSGMAIFLRRCRLICKLLHLSLHLHHVILAEEQTDLVVRGLMQLVELIDISTVSQLFNILLLSEIWCLSLSLIVFLHRVELHKKEANQFLVGHQILGATYLVANFINILLCLSDLDLLILYLSGVVGDLSSELAV